MPVPYIFITQNAPLKKGGIQEQITYARTVSSHKADTDELAMNISSRCTVNPADVAAVLYALGDELKSRLSNGEIVELKGIGSFRFIGGTGAIQAFKKISAKDFIKRKINFYPDDNLKNTLASLSFVRKKKK
ncbi:MAG: HU family DNA-binding protein [Balneola sp.]|nr:HU family DNA-binding protein [Balneola sp.]MBO6652329.1 HU family DNA-binding protein [Balneola sp.]MBO6712915.1 HU family DNA-binding protein [Balneola sp.]MBO6801609.1 HU family DNA-binding protein [Balneola sp.]MBO6871928.1 HU family DNA-binding protein [Balneola sp.]